MDFSEAELENAIKQMQDMSKKSTMPPVPPFVKMRGDTTKSTDEFKTVSNEKPKLFSKDIFKFLDLKNFEMDSDRILLLVMISMLSGESQDEILLFALLYIML